MKSKPKKYVWGTCAGLILLAEEIFNEKDGGQCKIGGLDIIVSRNSYGRQRESFEQKIPPVLDTKFVGREFFLAISTTVTTNKFVSF